MIVLTILTRGTEVFDHFNIMKKKKFIKLGDVLSVCPIWALVELLKKIILFKNVIYSAL